jgi:hypothetical protein
MVEVIWKGKGPAQRIHDRLKQGSDKYPLKPNASVTTNPTRCITQVYYGSSQAPSDKGHGADPDQVDAAVASKGGVR